MFKAVIVLLLCMLAASMAFAPAARASRQVKYFTITKTNHQFTLFGSFITNLGILELVQFRKEVWFIEAHCFCSKERKEGDLHETRS